ncbi:hypothetical protein A1F94_013607 [Pyrenophora tritici-repentis]|uniref:Uncharacterized protein n=1 Tax=Pyrenophora tritici-repentis TaxID=45151 RepID=A0A317AGN6_9PLEO|nr:hypothetical protein PtrV1_05163 [Pyrenophora tritici-repentis]KAG9375863.1 hypothetical protein A1F94_013607 [Pyrenophora tritici-repentis]KAI1507455.1 hypothetical protein Ptr86124_013632 [Pyrenophora tritici-repentis]KAI1685671.1 hypothetical protein KJE20_03636 [Pyrenophora tritici-repentis]
MPLVRRFATALLPFQSTFDRTYARDSNLTFQYVSYLSLSLCALPYIQTIILSPDYIQEGPLRLLWAAEARQTNLIYKFGVDVGVTASGGRVWAHLDIRLDLATWDDPQRAFIIFQIQNDTHRTDGLAGFDEVAQWEHPLDECEDDVARWVYIYDALVEEAKFPVYN